VGCGRPHVLLCDACRRSLHYAPAGFCHACGRPLSHTGPGLCPLCARQAPSLTDSFAVAYSTGVIRSAIHKLKYSDQSRLAEPLAELLAGWWRDYPLPADVIIPIPLHPRRERERGYNQSALLARRLGQAIGAPVDETSLSRVRDTQPQVGLGHIARRENVSGAFQCTEGALAGRRVLLIDDVTTTGATLEAAAHALKEAGARMVWGLTVARAHGRSDHSQE
jgi:competence protein ComFC